MSEFNSYEYVVSQKIEGKWLLRRILLILGYVVGAAITLAVGILSRLLVPLLALTPFAVWVMVFITWRYVSVEYEYSMVSGVFTFSKVYGKRSRKKIIEIPIKSMTCIAPSNFEIPETQVRAQENITRFSPETELIAVSSFSSPDVYYALYIDPKTEKKGIIWFEATEKSLKVFKFYNSPATIVSKVRY